jgi:rSAM/selenodomain-associated transferase 1
VPEKSRDQEVLIFARFPEAGRCKTRLAKGVGNDAALRIYRALLDHTLAVARSTPFRTVLLADPPERAADGTEWAPGMDAYRGQASGDLGARLIQAFAESFEGGARKVIVIGCDCPQLSKVSLVSSFTALDEADTVLGPTVDGGYYLLGLKESRPSLFKGIPWSTEQVYEKTLNILKFQTLSYISLDAFSDVDTLEDYERVRHLEPLKHLGTR